MTDQISKMEQQYPQCQNYPFVSSSLVASKDKATKSVLIKRWQQDLVVYGDKYVTILKNFISAYTKFLQNPARQDAILKTVQYTLWLLARFYGKYANKDRNNKNSNMAESLFVLSGEISWTRYILRFFGFPAALEGIESGSWALPLKDSKLLGKAMAWTMIAYYPLEHISYLYWKAPKVQWLPSLPRTSPIGLWRQNSISHVEYCPVNGSEDSSSVYSSPTSLQLASKTSSWSCRFWFAYLLLDIGRSVLVLEKQTTKRSPENGACSNKKKEKDSNKDGNGVMEDNVTSADSMTVRTARLQIIRDLLYVLPAIHWSLPKWDTKPWLPDDVVFGLCWLESIVGLYQAIRNFQQP